MESEKVYSVESNAVVHGKEPFSINNSPDSGILEDNDFYWKVNPLPSDQFSECHQMFQRCDPKDGMTCHSRELDWLAYVESFGERYRMEAHTWGTSPERTFNPDDLVRRHYTQTSQSKATCFGSKTAEVASPVYFGNSSVQLVDTDKKDQASKIYISWSKPKREIEEVASSVDLSSLSGIERIRARKKQFSLPLVTVPAGPALDKNISNTQQLSSSDQILQHNQGARPTNYLLRDHLDKRDKMASPSNPGNDCFATAKHLINGVLRSTVEIRNIFNKCTSPRLKFYKENSQLPELLGRAVLFDLCPALLALASHGIKSKFNVWQVIRIAAVPVPGVNCINDLALQIATMSIFENNEERFNSFIAGLLNRKIMETWLLLMLKNADSLKVFYETSAALPAVLTQWNELFTSLLLSVQPLVYLPFDVRLDFEHIFTRYHLQNESTSQDEQSTPIVMMSSWNNDGSIHSYISPSFNEFLPQNLENAPVDQFRCWDIIEASFGLFVKKMGSEGKQFLRKSGPVML